MSFRSASFGLLGTGKTTDAVHHLLMYHKKQPKNPIYSNTKIKGIKTIPITDPEIFFEIDEPCFVLPDEFWMKADSHKRGKINDCLSLISMRSRKMGWRLHYTLQMITQIEKRIRYVTEVWRRPFFDDVTGLSEVEVYSVEGQLIDTVVYDAWYVQKFFNSYDDPLDFDVDALLATYRRHKKEWA
ncbi:MAG: hypothetical protein NWF01_06705 [Candidatus Bathyarchaeota archaeon]|nr:hypothetical protein [Candidatus Bathyarchaeota archaeon]